MRILVVQNVLPPGSAGGAEQVCRNAVIGLLGHGHQVGLLTSAPTETIEGVKGYSGLRLLPLVEKHASMRTMRYRIIWLFLGLLNRRYTERVLAEFTPDVVYFHNQEWLTAGPVSAVATARIPFVLHAHNHHFAGRVTKKGGVGTRLYRLFLGEDRLSPTTSVIAVSEDIANGLISKGFHPDSTHVIYNSLPDDMFKAAQTLSAPRKEKTIVFAGVMANHKGVRVAVEAVILAKKKMPDLSLALYGPPGDEQYARDLRELVVLHDLGSSIVFHGPVPREELWQAMVTSELLIMPSLCREAFGLVAAEAMLAGAIVIGSNRGAIPEVVGECGFLAEPTPESFAETILKVAALPEKQKGQLREKARDRVHTLFMPDIQMERIMRILSEVSGKAEKPTAQS